MKNKKPKIQKYPNGGYTPNDEFNSEYDKTFGMTSSGVSAISPLWGGVTKAIGQVAKPIRSELDKTETGRKVNYGMGWVFSPLETAVASQQTGVGSPNEYNQQYIDQQNLNKQQFAMGGMNNIPNAELENKEVFKTPNGQVNSVNGPSHEQGGVPVNIPNGTKILSDKLKMNGKTFAKLGAKYTTNKEDKIINDDKATSASKASAKLAAEIKQKKLDQLFNAQETLKQTKLANYASKLGVTLPTQEFKYGGIKKYVGGGMVDEYKQENPEFWMSKEEADNLARTIEPTTPELTTPNPYGDGSAKSYNSDYDPAYDKASMMSEYSETNPEFWNGTNTPSTEKKNIPYGDIASGVAQSAGAIYGLATNKRPKGVNYAKPSVKYLDPKEELRANAIANANSRKMLKDVVGGNAGAYLANINQIGASNAERDAATITKYNNANSGIYNQNQSEVANIKNREIDATAQDMAKYRDINTAYVGQIGSNAANMYRDNKLMKQDYKTLGMISQMYPNYQYNPRTGEWKHRETGTKLTQEELNKVNN